MLNKSWLLLLIALLITPVLAADLTFPYGKQIDIKWPCFNNETFCSASANCNLTITYPDGSILVDNKAMTNSVAYHNYTIIQEDNKELGIHHATMICKETGGDIKGNGRDRFTIEITGDGNAFSAFPLQFVLLMVGFVLIVTGKFREDFRLLKHAGSILVLVMGVITLYPGYSFINYSNLQGMAMGYTSIGLGFYFLIEDSFSRGKQKDTFEQEEEDDGRFHEND